MKTQQKAHRNSWKSENQLNGFHIIRYSNLRTLNKGVIDEIIN